MHRSTVVATLVAGLLAIPTAALAHPSFNPSSIPAGEAVDAMLVVPHGCAPGGGMPDSDDGAEASPTVELAVQQQEGVTLTPGDVEGWDVTDDGEAWVWTDAGGATTDVLQFPVTITLDAGLAAGDRLYLKAFQECADGNAFQWIGTPDEDAEWPAVLLEASDGGTGEAEADEGMAMDHDGMDMGDDGDMDMEDSDMDMESDDDMAMDDGMDMEDSDDMAMDDAATEDDGGLPTGLVVVVALVVLAAAAGLAVRSRAS